MNPYERLFNKIKLHDPGRQILSVDCKRCFIVIVFSLTFDANILQASEKKQVDVLTVATAIDIAVRDNPNLAQMKSRYAALAEIPPQAGALPDPMINVNGMNFPMDSYDKDQEAMTQIQIGISQSFPFPGKLGLREKAAEYDAQAAEHSVEEVRLQLIKNVKSKWWQLYYFDRALDTVDQNQMLVRQFIAVAKTKYETGKGLQQDVLLAQLELSKLIDHKIQLHAFRRNQLIHLNVLMGRPANTHVLLPKKISKAMPDLSDEDVLYKKAALARPLLRQMAMQVDAAKTRVNIAKRDYYPDFVVGLTYGNRDGENPPPRGGPRSDFLSAKLGVKIPLYVNSKQSKAKAQKAHELQKNRYALSDEKSEVMGEVSSAVTDYFRARKQVSLFESGIVPQASQTVDSMLAGYQVSEVDFLNLIRSQITLFNYQLQYWKALSEAKQALARLESAVGEESIYE